MLKRSRQESAQCIPLDEFSEDNPQAYLLSSEVKYLEKERRQELLAAFEEMTESDQLLLLPPRLIRRHFALGGISHGQ